MRPTTIARALCALGASWLALTGCARPQHRDATAAEPTLLRLTSHEFGFEVPARVPAGLTRVRLVNRGTYWHHAELARFDSTLTREGYIDQICGGAEFPVGATDMGGTALVAPGDSLDVVMRLTPGRWAAICFASGGGVWHPKLGMVTPFEVTARPGPDPAVEPKADLVLDMRDDGFGFPDTLVEGRRCVRIENTGRDFHEADFIRLDPGRTYADYVAWRKDSKEVPPGPGVPVGGCSDFGPGGRMWSFVDFRPGQYFVICDMHADSGGVRHFVVTPKPR